MTRVLIRVRPERQTQIGEGHVKTEAENVLSHKPNNAGSHPKTKEARTDALLGLWREHSLPTPCFQTELCPSDCGTSLLQSWESNTVLISLAHHT